MDTRRQAFYERKKEIEELRREDNPNLTADYQIVKYTINLPVDMYEKIDQLCYDKNGCFIQHKSEWIRAALKKVLSECCNFSVEKQYYFYFLKKSS